MDTLAKIKTALRISHSVLDDDIQADIDACLADLALCGIIDPQPSDPLILNAVKLWCRTAYADDAAKSAVYQQRYDALKGSLQLAAGYGWKDGDSA